MRRQDDENFVILRRADVVGETAKALWVTWMDGAEEMKRWFPKSTLGNAHRLEKGDGPVEVWVREWFAKEHGIDEN